MYYYSNEFPRGLDDSHLLGDIVECSPVGERNKEHETNVVVAVVVVAVVVLLLHSLLN